MVVVSLARGVVSSAHNLIANSRHRDSRAVRNARRVGARQRGKHAGGLFDACC